MHVSQRLACCQSRQLGDETFFASGIFRKEFEVPWRVDGP